MFALQLLWLGATQAGLRFHAPVLVGPGSGYASNFNAIAPSVFVGYSRNAYLSVDGGATWNPKGVPAWNGFSGFAGVVGSTFFRTDIANNNTIRNLGFDLAGVESSKKPCGTAPGVNDSWYSCYTAFSTPWYSLYSIDKAGHPTYTRVNATTTFSGFPFPVSIHGDTAKQTTEHDFGRDGGGVALLSDGTLVLTADVRWAHDRGAIANAARAADLTLATNVVALRSTDGGKTFVYTATLCDAAHHRGCGECCNENDVVALADGKSVMSVWRMGAGDGLIWNKSLGINGSYHFYNHAISTDGGLTFSPEAPMPTMGCAKPMLARVEGGPHMPVILGGGRKRLMNTSDVLIWSNADGMGQGWQEHSISFWHNQLAQPPLQRFTRQVNSTKEPRQTSSYVSLLNAGAGEFVVTYELRKTPDEASRVGAEKDTVFAMRVTVNV